MIWPPGSDVPDYFVQGMSFDELLRSFKRLPYSLNSRSKNKNNVIEDDDSLDDVKMDGINRKGHTKLGLRKGRSAGIQKLAASAKAAGKKGKIQTQGCAVSVRNVPYKSSEGELYSHFSHIGRILTARVDRNDSGKSCGTATVVFASRKEAMLAVESMQNTNIDGRVIHVTLA